MARARAKKCEILVLNQIAQVGLKRFPAERYSVVREAKDPEAILVRSADLHKHAIWTCPLFPHFLQWLYEQLRDCRNPVKTLEGLPKIVELNGPEVRRSMSGQRYPGPAREPGRELRRSRKCPARARKRVSRLLHRVRLPRAGPPTAYAVRVLRTYGHVRSGVED